MDTFTLNITGILALMCVPSAFTGFCFWLLERRIQKRDAEEKKERERREKLQDEREQQRKAYELCQLNMTIASMALAEATAEAVQRIPDAHCNGDMHAALEYARKIKSEQRDFLRKQAVNHIDF